MICIMGHTLSLDEIDQLAAAINKIQPGTNMLQADSRDILLHQYAEAMGYIQEFDLVGPVSVNQNADIITPKALSPILRKSLFRVEVAFSFSGVAPKFHKMTKRAGSNNNDQVLGGAAFVTGVAQSFDTVVQRGDLINFQIDQTGVTIDYLHISEVPINS